MAAKSQISARVSEELSRDLESYCASKGLVQKQFIESVLRLHISSAGERCVKLRGDAADALAAFTAATDFDEHKLVTRIIHQHVGGDPERACLTLSRASASAFREMCERQKLDRVGAADEAVLQFVDSRGSQPHAFFFRLDADAALRVSVFWEVRGEPKRERLVADALLAYIDSVLEYDHGTRDQYEKMLAERQRQLN